MIGAAPVTVLGIGNPIMGDDGVGLAILDRMRELYDADERVEFIDGGTSGMQLLPVIQDAHSLVLLDAVANPQPPGTVIHMVGDQVPRLLSAKLSPHQVGLLDILAAARLLGREPERVALLGVVPLVVDLQVGLSQPVAAAVEPCARAACQMVTDWLVS